ncbi:uncharacterized protein JCM10292_004166 [Rhodotorula paludigena]|uniref:uncharacterized protein n=1 Tax=Rhodotorula paludigena TaxID=86838 RepID=UPI003176BCB1
MSELLPKKRQCIDNSPGSLSVTAADTSALLLHDQLKYKELKKLEDPLESKLLLDALTDAGSASNPCRTVTYLKDKVDTNKNCAKQLDALCSFFAPSLRISVQLHHSRGGGTDSDKKALSPQLNLILRQWGKPAKDAVKDVQATILYLQGKTLPKLLKAAFNATDPHEVNKLSICEALKKLSCELICPVFTKLCHVRAVLLAHMLNGQRSRGFCVTIVEGLQLVIEQLADKIDITTNTLLRHNKAAAKFFTWLAQDNDKLRRKIMTCGPFKIILGPRVQHGATKAELKKGVTEHMIEEIKMATADMYGLNLTMQAVLGTFVNVQSKTGASAWTLAPGLARYSRARACLHIHLKKGTLDADLVNRLSQIGLLAILLAFLLPTVGCAALWLNCMITCVNQAKTLSSAAFAVLHAFCMDVNGTVLNIEVYTTQGMHNLTSSKSEPLEKTAGIDPRWQRFHLKLQKHHCFEEPTKPLPLHDNLPEVQFYECPWTIFQQILLYTDKASRGKGLIRFRVGNNNLDGNDDDVGVL